MNQPAARIVIDGETVELELPPEWLAPIERALGVAQKKRERDLDRIVAAELERDPDATLDLLCAIARRNRQEVARSRKRVLKKRESRSDFSAPGSAVPGPENGMSAPVADDEGEVSAS